MLNELYIRNYLFVREERISFAKGLTVITGETGAGKSILVGSISAIFGDKGSDPDPLDPLQPVYLEASFDFKTNKDLSSFLTHEGYDELEELILARELSPKGKSQYFLNGRKISQGMMRELKQLIIDFHHQRDQQRLLNPLYQLDILDAYGMLDEKRESFAIAYQDLRKKLRLLDDLKAEEAANNQIKELYQYQFEELDKARLIPGEDVALQQEFDLLSHSREIIELSSFAYSELVDSEESTFDRLRRINSRLEPFSHINQSLQEAVHDLQEAQQLIQTSASSLLDIGQSLNLDPGRLVFIEERLDLINSLIYKHKVKSITELLELFRQRQQQLNDMADNSQRIISLEKELIDDYAALQNLADILSDMRERAADQLSNMLKHEVRILAIPKAEVEIRIDKKALEKKDMRSYLSAIDETGQDIIQFLFSANPGGQLKPLTLVASGGELSRVLLAIKKLLSSRIPSRLVILDEIDAGMGGKTAEDVADFIHDLSKTNSVLCITHLAQIASRADTHIAIEKTSEKETTIININKLAGSEKQAEIARMLSGEITEISLLHAKELIKKREVSREEKQ